MTKKVETPKKDDSWKSIDLEKYAKGNLELCISFLRMALTTPAVFDALVAAMEDHRTSLIRLEEDAIELAKAEKEANV